MVVGVNTNRRAVGVFSTRRDVEGALHELRDSGFPMDRASVIAQNSDSTDDIAGAEVRERVGNKADEGATVGALSGGTLGGLTGLLVGLGALAIPGIGPIMLAGATATALATTLAGAGIGAVAGSLAGGLIGLGIPEEEARAYNERVERGHYLVIIDGTNSEIATAQAILERRGIEDFAVYNQPNTTNTDNVTTTTPIPAVPIEGVGFTKHAIGYFQTRNDAEAAINDLRSAGFPLSQISLIHRDSLQRELLIGVTESDRFDAMRLGLPDARARFYNERIIQGDYVLIASGTEDEINRAAVILSRRGIRDWEMYDPSAITTTAPFQRTRRAIGVFPHRRDAEAAITELRDAGFPLNQVSLIAKDVDGNNPIGGVNTQPGVGNKVGEGVTAGAVTGGALGGLGGLLVGLGALAIPGVGPVIAGGALATALATAATGGAIGAAAGGLTGGLAGLGIPENRARAYSDRFNRGDYLVLVDGTDEQLRHAEAILKRHNIQDFDMFDQPDVTNRTTDFTTTTPTTTYDPTIISPAPVQRARRAIGVFPHRRDAEAAITELRDAGFPLNQVSLIAKDVDGNNPIGGVNTQPGVGNKVGEGVTAGAVTGGALGGLGGLLVGLGALAIPGVGPVIAGGALATALATAATGGAIGAAAGGLTGGLAGLGIPENRARAYSDRFNRGDYLVLVDGTDEQLRHAEAILKRHNIQDFEMFDQPDVTNRTTDFTTTTPTTTYDPTIISQGSVQRARRAIGVFPHRRDAEAAITELRDAGFPLNQVSLIAKDVDGNNPVGGVNTQPGVGNKADEGAKAGALTGGALGGLGGLLVGLGALAIPGVGPVIAGGAIATALATAATGGAIGAAAGGLTGGLAGLGIPENRARAYSDRFNRGDYLVFVDGTDEQLRHAQTILQRHSIQDFDIFDAGRDGVRQETPVVNTTNYSTGVNREDPAVIIIDNRDERV